MKCHSVCWQTLLEIDELLKHLDRAENDLQSAESIRADPETLALQLAQHKVNNHGAGICRLSQTLVLP